MTTTASVPSLTQRRSTAVARGVSSVAPFYVDHATGATLTCGDREYLDFASGIAVTSLGHGDARITAAITGQLEDFLHTCFMLTPYEEYIAVCEALNDLLPYDARSVLFTTGAEAVENAVKVARAATGRAAVLTFDHAYHGRTQLTMTMTAKHTPYKRGFGPFSPEVYRAPSPYPLRWPGDAGQCAVRALDRTREIVHTQIGAENLAAIVIEPIQGEGGFIEMPAQFLQGLRSLADDTGAVMIADEIQTGFCRTGSWLAIQAAGVVPDLVTLAKGIANGMPLAAVTGRADIVDAVPPGGLGGTYAGNPLSCAAALATIGIMRTEDAPGRARRIGERFAAIIDPLVGRNGIAQRRGRGAMQAVEFVSDDDLTPSPERTAAALRRCLDAGLLALTCGTFGNVLRFLPPLTIGDDDLDRGLAIIRDAITSEAA